ncbi:hypothetical protein CPB84DRAFT_1781550 [Gymnopilus junonius]|uniref:Uncharacterized protein n=1 Tax=Gymnopilus junonius TaxID=109634 RepID=A0A9P5NNV4_GYMJU|nr:hypothetical protein CPB84DRAFT_1781550 [Gymnopilus junonius]
MSSSEQVPGPSQQQQQQSRVRKPPFADWPTIKILTPPQGRFSPKVDEWCFTYCTQSVSGRIHGKEPNCHSICLRKVFPHEVRNVVAFKHHNNVGPDGKAKYLLPAEGQSANLPRMLGGSKDVTEDNSSKPKATQPKYWDEGWYLWTATGRWAVVQKTEKMMLDLQHQQQLEQIRQSRKEIWQDYQEQLKQNVGDKPVGQTPPQAPWWGPIVPPKNIQDTSSLSLLVPLPPEFPPLLAKINKLLAPTYEALNITFESITSGEQKQFAQRVWEKAKTEEPLILAQRTFSHAYEQWKKRDMSEEEDDEKKGST